MYKSKVDFDKGFDEVVASLKHTFSQMFANGNLSLNIADPDPGITKELDPANTDIVHVAFPVESTSMTKDGQRIAEVTHFLHCAVNRHNGDVDYTLARVDGKEEDAVS